MEYIKGGVCAPKGFKAAGEACGFKKKDKKDLALIYSEKRCSAAGVYTTNKVQGAPITVTKSNISDGMAQAMICNSGNANTCAANGIEIAEKTCLLVGKELDIRASDVIVCSTGVIGQELTMDPFESGVPLVVEKVLAEGVGASTAEAAHDAASSIMTTDTMAKEVAVEFMIGGMTCRIGGMCKGSGMINPKMATMLAFITTDVAISPKMLKRALTGDVAESFNQICVDGDTSTNDMAMIMANGLAENDIIDADGEDFLVFIKALNRVTTYLAKKMARDGEGATKLIECDVTGANSVEEARLISKSVISSNLLKAAMFGEDANWGRVLCAIGNAPGEFSAENIDVEMCSDKGSIVVCEGSKHKEYSEEIAAKILSEENITIKVNMNQGDKGAMAWGCDLTYDYVKINGDYRT